MLNSTHRKRQKISAIQAPQLYVSPNCATLHRPMQIKLSYVGYLKFEGVQTGDLIEVDDGATISDVLANYKIPPHQQRFLTTFVNEEEQSLRYQLQDGDELMVIIQIGGGCPRA